MADASIAEALYRTIGAVIISPDELSHRYGQRRSIDALLAMILVIAAVGREKAVHKTLRSCVRLNKMAKNQLRPTR